MTSAPSSEYITVVTVSHGFQNINYTALVQSPAAVTTLQQSIEQSYLPEVVTVRISRIRRSAAPAATRRSLRVFKSATDDVLVDYNLTFTSIPSAARPFYFALLAKLNNTDYATNLTSIIQTLAKDTLPELSSVVPTTVVVTSPPPAIVTPAPTRVPTLAPVAVQSSGSSESSLNAGAIAAIVVILGVCCIGVLLLLIFYYGRSTGEADKGAGVGSSGDDDGPKDATGTVPYDEKIFSPEKGVNGSVWTNADDRISPFIGIGGASSTVADSKARPSLFGLVFNRPSSSAPEVSGENSLTIEDSKIRKKGEPRPESLRKRGLSISRVSDGGQGSLSRADSEASLVEVYQKESSHGDSQIFIHEQDDFVVSNPSPPKEAMLRSGSGLFRSSPPKDTGVVRNSPPKDGTVVRLSPPKAGSSGDEAGSDSPPKLSAPDQKRPSIRTTVNETTQSEL